MIFAGLDTASRLVCVLDASGQLLARVRLQEAWWGLRQLHGLLADLGGDACEFLLGVEQQREQRGLLVELLVGAGYQVFGLSGSTLDLCRLLRSAAESREPSRAEVIAGLVRTLHSGLHPLTASVSLAGYARHYRQLAWARRYEQHRLRGLLAHPTADGGWPQEADIDRPGGPQRLVEALGMAGRAGSHPPGSAGPCLAALADLDLRLVELERRVFEALSPGGGDYESWRPGDEEGAGGPGPTLGVLPAGRGRIRVAAAAVMGLSLGLVVPGGRSPTPSGASALAPPPPEVLNSKPEGDGGLWWRAAPVAVGTKHPVAQTAAHPGEQMAADGPNQPADALRPVAVEIPAIDLVTPPLVDLGLNPDGGLQVPVEFALAGWYVASAVPGDPGPAVIVGHYDSRRGPAVFYRLAELTPGDVAVVSRSDNSSVTFLVEHVARYPKDRFPTEEVYGPTGEPTLRLITCGGRFDRARGHYDDNLVVFARQLHN